MRGGVKPSCKVWSKNHGYEIAGTKNLFREHVQCYRKKYEIQCGFEKKHGWKNGLKRVQSRLDMWSLEERNVWL